MKASIPNLRSIILANIVTLVFAAGTVIWNWSAFATRLHQTEVSIQRLQSTQQATSRALNDTYSTLISIQAELTSTTARTERLEALHFEGGADTRARAPTRVPAPQRQAAVTDPPLRQEGLDGS